MVELFWLFVLGIVYTYVGYPLLVALIAYLRPRSAQYTATEPFVTLIVAAYNEQDIIAEKIENSLALDYSTDRLQILVAADGSDDRTPDIVRSFAHRGVELSYHPQRLGKMAAVNRATARARGEIVVFSDANNTYAPDAIRALVLPFSDQTVGVVTGAKSILRGDGLLGNSEGLYWKYEAFIKAKESRLGCCTSVVGEILAIRRTLFESAPVDIINDDFYTAMRIVRRGYRIAYAPDARSTERISLSNEDEIERRTRIIVGRFQAIARAYKLLPFYRPLVVWQVVSHKFLRPLVPLFMVGALIANIVMVVAPGYGLGYFEHTPIVNWILLTLQMVFYGMAWIGSKIQSDGMIGKVLFLPTFLFNSNFAAVAGLYRFLTKGQDTQWRRAQRREDLA